MSRPLGLTVIAWGAIATGTLAVFSGVMAVWSARGTDVPSPFQSSVIVFMFRHFVLFAAVQVVLGGLVVAAGASLLRLRRWAARVLEVVAWATLAYVLFFTGIFIQEILFRMTQQHEPASGFNVGKFLVFFAGLNLLLWGTPLAAVIIVLRRASKRAVFA